MSFFHHAEGEFHFMGPRYCETPLVSGETYTLPFEFVNSMTSLIPSMFACLALLYLQRKGVRRPELYAMVLFLFSVGVGSALWHGWRTSLTLTIDVLPGLLFFLGFMFLWPYYLKNRWWAYGTILSFVGLQFLAAQIALFMPVDGPPISFFVGIFILGAGLVYATYRYSGLNTMLWAIAALGSATAAAVFRSIDLITCGIIPFGSHFMWHVCLGLSAYCGIVLLAKLYLEKHN